MGRRRVDRQPYAADRRRLLRRVPHYLVNAFGTRVDAWEIWNEEDSTAWWTGTPAQYAGLLRRPTRRSNRRTRSDRAPRRADRQRRGLPGRALRGGRTEDPSTRVARPHRHGLQRDVTVRLRVRSRDADDQPVLLPRLHGGPRGDGRRRGRRQAHLHDRARLVLYDRANARPAPGPVRSSPASTSRRRPPTCSRPTTVLPSRSTPTSRPRCGSNSLTTATRPPTRQLRPAQQRLHAQARVRRVRARSLDGDDP